MKVTNEYFRDRARRRALVRELESWRGTRFFPNLCKKGVGVDCVQFAAQVLIDVGALAPFHFPKYAWRSGGPDMLVLLRSCINSHPELVPIWPGPGDAAGWPELLPGDVFAFSTGVANHHLGIYAGDNTLYHVLARRGVCQANVTDPTIRGLTVGIWRPVEIGVPL